MFLSDAQLSIGQKQVEKQPLMNHNATKEACSPNQSLNQTSNNISEALLGEKAGQQHDEIPKPVSFLRQIYELRKAFQEYRSLPATEETIVKCNIGLDDFEILLWFESEQRTRSAWSEPSIHKFSYSRFLQRRVQVHPQPDSFLRRVCVLREAFQHNSSPSISEIEQISCETGLEDFEVSFWFETENSIQSECLTKNMPFQQDPWSPRFSHSSMDSRSSLTGTSLVSDNAKLNPPYYPKPGSAGNLQMDLAQWETPSLAARSNKRQRPVHSSSNVTLASIASPPNKRLRRIKVQGSFPCLFERCGSIAADAQGWREHQSRSHFPKRVWICWLKKDDESDCKHGPSTRIDNFVTHLVNEHHQSRGPELQKLVQSKGLNVRNLYHEECGFCARKFRSWEDSMKHIGDHLSGGSTAESWEHRCSSDHDLLSHIEYQSRNGRPSDHKEKPEDEDERDDDTDPSGNRGADSAFGDQNQDSQDPEHQNEESQELGDHAEWGAGASSPPKDTEDTDMQVDFHDLSSNPATISVQANEVDRDYISLEMLGHGGFSFVDKIVHRVSKKIYARKTTFYHKSPSGESMEIQFQNEVDILKTLQHPHLVKFIDAYALEDRLSIIMSPVADESLTSFMSRFDKFPPALQKSNKSSLWRWISCLASALAYLHGHLIRHQDIKPSNILVRGDQVFLTDFGNARKFLDNNQAQVCDFRNRLTVTPMYCSPEAMRSGLQGFTADVFSLGCVYAEIITLCLDQTLADFKLFRSPNPYDGAFRNQLEKTVEWIESLQEDYRQAASQHAAPPSVSLEMVCRMLDQDPELRPTARQIQLQLLPCTCYSTVVTAIEKTEDVTRLYPSTVENALDQDENGHTLPTIIPTKQPETIIISEIEEPHVQEVEEIHAPQASIESEHQIRIVPRPAQVSDYESDTDTGQNLETHHNTTPSPIKKRSLSRAAPKVPPKARRGRTIITVEREDHRSCSSEDSSSESSSSNSSEDKNYDSETMPSSRPSRSPIIKSGLEKVYRSGKRATRQHTRFHSSVDEPAARTPYRAPPRRRSSYNSDETDIANPEDSIADAYYSGVVAGVAAAAQRTERIPPTPPLTNAGSSIRTSGSSVESRSMDSRSPRQSLGSCISIDENSFRRRDHYKFDEQEDYIHRTRLARPKLRDAEYDYGYIPSRKDLLSRRAFDSYEYPRNPFAPLEPQPPLYQYPGSFI
jgi:serine/threonine protein kinase